MEKSFLKLGKETYGDKKMEAVFREAFAPYFNDGKSVPQIRVLNRWSSMTGTNMHSAYPADVEKHHE